MLQTKLVYGIYEWNDFKLHAKHQIDNLVNAAIEELESEGMRVRDVRFQFDRITSKGSNGYAASSSPYAVAVIYYDDSARYAENPEEIEDAYHRKSMMERPKFEGVSFMDDDSLDCLETDENLDFIEKGVSYDRKSKEGSKGLS